MPSGLRLDTAISTIKRRLAKLDRACEAREFRPELERFATATLKTCIAMTPERNPAKIAMAQGKQYRNRVDYIPSVHTQSDPMLIVNEEGQPWVKFSGRWYLATNHMPAGAWGAYQQLNAERQRRLQTARGAFIAHRMQARFLYQRSWYQVAQSLGLMFAVVAAISSSRTRRKPAVEPPRGYGQWRGGKTVLSISIVNRFLDVATNAWMITWRGNGKQILAEAAAKNRPRFIKDVNDKVKREISAARRVK